MPIVDKATARVVAVIVLLIATAAALRGYLPGVQHADRPPPQGNASLAYVAVLLGVSLVIVGVSVIARLRDPRRVAGSASPLPTRLSKGGGRPAWRVLLIAAGVLLVWLVLLWVLSRYIGPQQMDQPPSVPRHPTPPPSANVPQPPGRQDAEPDRGVLRYLIGGTAALLAMIVIGAVLSRRRRVGTPAGVAVSPAGQPMPVAAAAATSLVRAAESGLAEVEDPNHEPRQAIIACYAAMERELRRFPGAIPQDFDTPTEVLARAVEHRALHVDSATELVNLFEEARFSPHVMTETHRGRAVDVLQLVLADIRSSV
ncbi:DUF4129 domain-containing protein [Candidatus Mycobacterium wuenschmannii]|uniref:DUF4129 domain-containing protein n=1 Tax=Candidatus Mycobacterium wuenschmannii TaxID=3027808 RepID=A0ABY8W7S4_9MYCO|nr:DUF4129 domain-containing protein [Candidatus Mycobacterium wuenschmannii]